MLNREIDNRGLTCPQPVLNTKKALEELARQGVKDYVLTAIVDNDAAKENVTRFATSAGCKVATEKKEDAFYITILRHEETIVSKPANNPEVIFNCHGKASAEETIFCLSPLL